MRELIKIDIPLPIPLLIKQHATNHFVPNKVHRGLQGEHKNIILGEIIKGSQEKLFLEFKVYGYFDEMYMAWAISSIRVIGADWLCGVIWKEYECDHQRTEKNEILSKVSLSQKRN